MPITVKDFLPAIDILRKENIYVMPKTRAVTQEIRPIKIAILNLMPNKSETETQFIRLLSNTPLQINIELIRLDTHNSSANSVSHLDFFYRSFSSIKQQNFDGLIVTGAALSHVPFDEVDCWDELKEVFAWAEKHVTSTLYSCWAAHAALFFHYNIARKLLKNKISGVFTHQCCFSHSALTRGFDNNFLVPHSRFGHIDIELLEQNPNLLVLAKSPEVGAFLIKNNSGSQVYITGHPEYDAHSLRREYLRDLERGKNPSIPKNYFNEDNVFSEPSKTWSSHAFLLFSNWLNYHVYQTTPYDINLISQDIRTNNFAE